MLSESSSEGLDHCRGHAACCDPEQEVVELTTDLALQVAHFAQDPLNFVGDLRARTANEILKGFKDVQHKEKQLRLPILAIHGTADKITSITAVKRLLASAASTDTELKEFPGGFHELLLGPEKEDTFVALRDWILRHSREPDAKL